MKAAALLRNPWDRAVWPSSFARARSGRVVVPYPSDRVVVPYASHRGIVPFPLARARLAAWRKLAKGPPRLDPGWTRAFLGIYNSAVEETRRAVMTYFYALEAGISIPKLAEALAIGDKKGALSATEIAETSEAITALEHEVEVALVAAGNYELTEIPAAAGFVFNPAAPGIRQWMKESAGARIKDIDKETRAAVRAAIGDAIMAGRHPYATARTIRMTVGLTRRQMAAVLRYEASLGPELTGDARAIAVKKYAEKLRAWRAENIARTESMHALNEGRYQARLQLVDAGVLPMTTQHEWRTALDERVCPVCGPANNERRRLGETFSTGVVRPPAHPQCRCITTIVT